MSEGLFSIFGDQFTTQAVQNVIRQPLTNNGMALPDIQFLLPTYSIIYVEYYL